jgi:Zn-dependent oligopeptidase
MFAMFEHDVLNGALGKRYRDIILARGYTVDSADSLREFLGREPNNAAFLQHIGLQ